MSTITQISEDVVIAEQIFSVDELHTINQLSDATLTEAGVVDLATGDNQTRKAEVAYIPRTAESNWIYQRLARVSQQINNEFFHLDVTGFIENGIFGAVYCQPGDNYDWHTDKTERNGTRKDFVKLTLVIQLSDPCEYQGGEVEVITDEITTIPKTQGLVYAIPGWVSHRVTPLRSGTRKVLIAWFTGPKFR